MELVFTPAGETIGTMTYFKDPENGERDALLHFVEGGVYPKWYSVVSEFKRTGDLMPVMTKFARIAPSGLVRYRGPAFGAEYEGNLFSAQFNPHRVQRHIVSREGRNVPHRRSGLSDFRRIPISIPPTSWKTPMEACWWWTPARGSSTAARFRA